MRKSIAELLRRAREEDWNRFDLAAECWVALRGAITAETTFLSQYCVEGAGCPNPNLSDLVSLEYRLCEDLAGPDGDYLDRSSAYRCIEKDLESFVPESFGDSSYNDATLLWALIRAIDLSFTEDRRPALKNASFPLNHAGREKVGIYTSACQGIVLEHFAKSRIERIPVLDFNSQLQNLLFYVRQGDEDYPRLVVADRSGFKLGMGANVGAGAENLVVGDKRGDASADPSDGSRELRIGMELFSGANISDFKCDAPIQFVRSLGSSYTVSYADEYASLFGPLVRDSIDRAIERGCDILVFPEIVMSPELVEVVCEHLKEPSRRGLLGLVVAGSGWYESPGGTKGNNVCVLIDGFGRIMGHTYKREPYVKKKATDEGCDLVEALADPGKEITVVDLPGVGRIVSAICKDVVADSRFPIDLSRDMNGEVLCMPALSSSLDRGFGAHLDLMSERNLAVGCICNLCAARRSHVGDTGPVAVCLVGYPAAGEGNPRKAHPKNLEIERGSRCLADCVDQFESGEPRSCLRVVRIESDDDGVGLVASAEWIACKQ